MARAGPDPQPPNPTAADSEQRWLSDLRALLEHAQHRFADVAWTDDNSGRLIHAHKCIVYARATGSFQQRYLGVPHSLSESDLSLYGPSTTSLRTFTPSSAFRRDSLTPTIHHNGRSPRPSSSTCHSGEGGVALSNGTQPLSLGETDISVFETALEYFYTASKESEAFVVALDGFQDGATEEEEGPKGVARLRQDLLYCWRSKLYADVSIVLDGVPGEPFAAHRAILASRSPYFRSLLLGSYSDSNANVFTLPSPPFTPASTTFVLGYMYTGTLDFSPRKFDLATHFEIWRCAAFLTLATLQSAIEAKLLLQLNLARAPRILAFAHAPDVGSARLAEAATPLVVEHFDVAWTATPHVGHLPYEVQKALVGGVCAALDPAAVAGAARQVARARRAIEHERAGWADHIRGMLDGVEEALMGVLAARLPEVVASSAFVDLIDGVGFNADVLEWLLTLVVKGLREAKAPEAYHALVGSVLLREEGIMADARMLVDDTRSGILSYIKRKWVNIRNAGGFEGLEAWCLKELADELDVSPPDLISDSPRPRTSPAKVRKPPQHLVDGVPSPVTRPFPRPNGAVRAVHASSPPASSATPTRPPRLSTTSTASRASTVASRAPAARTPVPRTPSTAAAPTATPPARRAASTTATPRVRPAPPATVVTQATPTARQRQVSGTAASASPAPVPAARAPATARPASIRSVASSAARARAPSTATAAEPSARRPASPAPSVASRRSVGSTATARTGARRPPVVASAAAQVVARRTTATSGATPASPAVAADPRRQQSSTSLRSTTSARATSAAAPLPPALPLRRTASNASLASRRSASTSTIAGAGASGTVRKAATPAAAAGAGGSTLRAAAAARTRPPLAPAVGPSRRAALAVAAAPPTPGLPVPGTTLLSGIPCIVTVRPSGQKPLRIKAQVRYIGEMVGEAGQWVGVEALESAIPTEAEGLEWGEGTRGDVSYFTLAPPSSASGAGAGASAPPSRAASPALRPPSRRGARRSTSPSGARESGPRKALFVRPDQIVYVL